MTEVYGVVLRTKGAFEVVFGPGSSVDTLVVKLAAMKRLDELIGRGARWLEALYDVAGMIQRKREITDLVASLAAQGDTARRL